MYSIALGKESHAEKSFSTSVGFKTEAKGLSSLALGSGVVPSKDLTGDGRVDEDDIALNRTIADGNAAFAAGASANATGSYASALGGESKATANAALAVGKMANASDQSTIAVGDNAQASGAKATSIGAGAIAKNEGTIAIGDRAKVGATNGNVAANNGIAIGTESESKNEQAIAVGKKAIAAGNNSIALGNETTTTGGEGVAIGNTASASHHSVAFGSQAKATATDGYSSAFGNESEANKADSSALGNTAKALAKNATSVGAHSKVTETAENGSALGRSANVSATNGTALGSSSSVTAANGTAVGTSATVTTAGGVALGQGSLSGRGALDKNKVKITAGHVEDSEGISQNDDKNNKNGDVYAPVKLIDKAEVLERVKNTILGSAGAVSLGKDGETTRQLTNLAPGSKDSDAVNVAQLKAVVGSIVKYNVTSPDKSITIDSKDETDNGVRKTTFNVQMNTDAVKNAAAWKIKANKETDDKATSVKGGDIVTFKAKDGGDKGDTIKISRNGKELTFEANFATIRTTGGTEGTVRVDNDVKDNWLAKAKNVAEAINASGWILQANGNKVGLVNPGDKVNIAPGNGITVTPTTETNGVSKITIDAKVADVQAGNNVTIDKNETTGVYTVNAKDTITTVKGKDGGAAKVTTATESTDTNKIYEVDVNVDGTTIVNEGGKLKAKLPDVSTTNLTVNEGKVTAPSTDDGKKLVNAATVANVVNNSYWKATRGESNSSNDDKAEDGATSNIKAGDELTFVAGKNMALKKAGNTFTYGTQNDVSFTTVTSNGVTVNGGGSLTVGAGSTINVGDNIIHGVKAGEANTDAVNVAQLKANAATVVAGKNVSVDVAENTSTGKTFTVHSEKTTVSGTGPVTVKATSDAANHTTNYNVEFDSSKAAEQTDLTYKANGNDAKKVKLSEGLDFTNGKGTKASVGENGKVTIDANVTDIAQGNNITVTKDNDGKYTISATNTITTVKGKEGSAAKVTTATGSTDTNKIYEVDVNVDGKTIVNENGTLQAKGWKTKVVKGEGEVEGSSEETVNGSDTVNYIAGKNVKLVQNGKNFTIATKDNVTFKDTTTTNLSVTSGGKVDMGNNKITNVAEGTENTDAVNVKQLKDFKSEVAEGGLTFAGNSGTAHKAKLNTTVNIKGGKDNTDATQFDDGKNVMTTVNGNTVTVAIKKTPEVEGINIIDTTGKVKVKLTQTDEGLKVSDGDNNATRITNVKAGDKDTDAVNVKQLNAAKTEVTAGDNIDVRSSTGANGQTIYKVSANDTSAAVKGGSDHVKVTKAANTHKDGSTTVTDYTVDLSDKTKEDIKKGVDAHTEVTTKGLTFNADTGTTGVKKLGSKVAVNGDGKNITTTADENGVKVSMKDDIKVNSVTAKEVKVGDVNINENGINAGGKRITNVAPGKDGTDAVNVNQLKYVAGNISNQINNVDKGLRAGIAGALASGGLYHVTTAGKSMVSVGAGTYRGQNALAVGYSRLSDNGKVGVKFTVNSNSQGHSGASASVGYQW